jgi:error-prone DNA polymerase
LGVIIFQDQVLKVCQALASFTDGQAESLRRAMSRKRSKEALTAHWSEFLAGATANGVDETTAREVFAQVTAFSEFGFPKSHAAAFALLAYQSAWLRHYYPVEFYVALFNNQPMGFYPPHVLVGDARRHGVRVLRVSINGSLAQATPGDGALLLGLTAVRGLTPAHAESIVAERSRGGPFRSLGDLVRRVTLPIAVATNLIGVGALAEFGLGRRELLWQLGLYTTGTSAPAVPVAALAPPATAAASSVAAVPIVRHGVPGRGAAAPSRRPAPIRQLRLSLPTEQDMVALPDMTTWERMVADYALLSLSPSYHPFALLRERLPRAIRRSVDLRRLVDGSRAQTAGLVVCRQRPGTAKGFVFLLLEDETGLTNAVVRPDLYDAHRSLIRGEPYLHIDGIVQVQSGSFNLIATRIRPVADLPGVVLPRPRLYQAYPGGPPDPRAPAPPAPDAAEIVLAQPPVEITVPAATPARFLQRAIPASHNFH